VELVHDTPNKKLNVLLGFGVDMIVHTLPFHSSASASVTSVVGSEYELTATQKLGLVHEMPRRPFADPPRLGLGVSDQLAGAASAIETLCVTTANVVIAKTMHAAAAEGSRPRRSRRVPRGLAESWPKDSDLRCRCRSTMQQIRVDSVLRISFLLCGYGLSAMRRAGLTAGLNRDNGASDPQAKCSPLDLLLRLYFSFFWLKLQESWIGIQA
jgi:hypothetical protein